ncbi:MAG TPA: 6-phosphogluconolactonase [Terracidiphilus sp.]|jgi:6-phosphogluconolactonase
MPRQLQIKYYVEPDPAALARHAAQYFVEMAGEAVERHGRARVALSGGATPKAAFELLADPAQPWRNRMPWQALDLYWVDERSVPPDHADSNYRMTREALLDHVPLRPEQIHRIEGELEPQAAAARYESELRNSFRLEGAEIPRFDLVALGLGSDGHTASLFPHTEALNEMSSLVAANFVPQKDAWRITLTWPVINHARSIFFLVSGEDKAAVLREVLTGPRDPERLPSQLIWPSSGILTFILDKAAAALLPATNGESSGVLEREQ